MRIDFSQFGKPPVLDYEAPPPPRTWRDYLVEWPKDAIEQFGGFTFTMLMIGLLLVALGMMIGGNGTIGMKIYFTGFIIVSILFGAWTMK